ncbi:vitelline membrane outer layer protein 1 homolog [Folsomia candida]|uniref:Vitelline membrane outer layer protein 1 n=1 Tax=Folsomia candida TaxID=158441 RepID=A0A226DD19_FOLCA|nr:vitelline membrane outer layer protein 1 homolog [Folsomia candida]OXA43465.1 Vitelline membrane outer layer protein 1 [Folsomia candida]
MTTKIIIPIIVFVFVGVAHSGEIIESERITNWGEWGSFHRCPNGTFAQGFRLRTEPYKGALIDDTASNAVRLFCGDPDNINTPTISSTEGHWGTWGEIFKCRPGGYIHGFSLRVEQPFLIPDDETATNNFRFYCNNDEPDVFLEGDGINRFGQWRSIKKCARSEALCALQTQVQRDQGLGDDTALNNISAECCSPPLNN